MGPRAIILAISISLCGCERSGQFLTSSEKPTGERELHLGDFAVDSGYLVVTDPGYDIETVRLNHGAERKASNGQWSARITLREFGNPDSASVGRFIVYHNSATDWKALDWQKEEYAMSVDTGQMSASDSDTFQDPSIIPDDQTYSFGDNNDEPAVIEQMWYSYCCEITTHSYGGVFEGGAVTSAGWGDGGYLGYSATDESGDLIGFRVEFIDERGN